LNILEGKKKIFLVGCGGCATVFHTGGETEVKERSKTLIETGKEVLAAIAPPFGEFTCYTPWSKIRLSQYRKEIEESDAILMLTCGDGLQVVRELILEEEFEITKPIYHSTNPIGHMGGDPALFKEKCQQCGECEIGRFVGIYPLTQCAKGLLNGPCGGSKNGECEVDLERDCAWIKIYECFKAFDELEKMRKIVKPRDRDRMTQPREIEVAPLGMK
jgi:hypothetical protein